MTAVTAPPWNPDAARPFTVEDLERMPDDGRRYELLDGVLIVSPAPGVKHQKIVVQLCVVLDAVCPDGLHVLPAPFAVQTSPKNELQPDILVAREDDLTETLLPVAPLLAVEVLSPSTALNDLNNKKAAYQRMGASSYWVIDPEGPRLTAFELTEEGLYQQVVDVKGEDVFEAVRPFPARVVPAELLGSLRGRFE